MRFTVLTLFPDTFESIFSQSILKRAIDSDLITINIVNIRDYSKFKHKQVDDVPYWWWAGMLMTCQPLFDCIEDVKNKACSNHIVIYLTPKWDLLKQESVEKFNEKYDEIILLCGHYEGIDQRIIDTLVNYEISIGDYILSSGEIAALVIIDSIVRLLPGVIKDIGSAWTDSFSDEQLLDVPYYTRPEEFMGKKVPEILLSGNHQKIAEWRQKMREKITKQRRPDLYRKYLESIE